ncbi:unnamed protein product [Dovyalis caffra]|uniref:Uncharacterized protein n=1 Tax=Dovyalis caffra TaxID=77055 RepID=A0AAV1QU07_9ROSI|nr:unnamed protein product [Dovyalis caffra]
MASSEDEADTLPESVSTYHFVDDKDEPISFSKLPIRWSESKSVDDGKKNYKIFLKGSVDNGLRTIYKQVIAWKFDLSNTAPQISVLTKEKCWMELEKPRKSYAIIIRTVLVTVHCLHFARVNPEVSGKSVWEYLSKTFSLYERRPSLNDLVEHMNLIAEAVKRENSLAKCKFLLNVLGEKSREKMLSDEDVQAAAMSAFIVDDVEDDNFEDFEEDESNDEDKLFDSVCAFCDNGGNLLCRITYGLECCEGSCLRSFHATVEAGEESVCESLGFTNREVEAMKSFFCKNCKYKQHQCFACGKLGSSDKFSGAEGCHFMQPFCWVAGRGESGPKILIDVLSLFSLLVGLTAAALRFLVCHPLHLYCPGQNLPSKFLSAFFLIKLLHALVYSRVLKLDFVVMVSVNILGCQYHVVFRCANATCGYFYHPHCVSTLIHREDEVAAEELQKRLLLGRVLHAPFISAAFVIKEIVFENEADEGTIARAWENLLPNSILIYCLKHEIIEEIGTPIRDHIRFPVVGEKKTAAEVQKRRIASGLPANEEEGLSKKRRLNSEKSFSGKNLTKASKEMSSAAKKVKITNGSEKISSESNSLKNMRTNDGSRNSLRENTKSGKAMPRKPDISGHELNKSFGVKSAPKKLTSELPSLDADAQNRLLALIKEAASSITLEEVIKKHEVPSTHANSSKNVVDKNITLGKVEVTVEAVRTALKKLEESSSIEYAKAVCEPGILNQVFKWKNKLKVYLAPFLYGMRYTSFGRHFTKVEKLMEIADILHWYVENGDMIVDFCCGANDFSCLMKKKLEETGKKCSYKNYDVIQPKAAALLLNTVDIVGFKSVEVHKWTLIGREINVNDFNFEKRDWMTVQPDELPKKGSQLIMGLNPPFGVKAALANKFIDKALQFKPKLLILIVPPETVR